MNSLTPIKDVFINSPILHQLPPEKILKLLERESNSKIKGYNTLFKDKISEPEIALLTNEIKTQRINNKILHKNIVESEKALKAMEVRLQRLQGQRKKASLGRVSSIHSAEDFPNLLRPRKSMHHFADPLGSNPLNSLTSISEFSTEKLKERHSRTLSELIKEERQHNDLEKKLKEVVSKLKSKTSQIKKEQSLLSNIFEKKSVNLDVDNKINALVDTLGKHYKSKRLKNQLRESILGIPSGLLR